MDCIFCKIIKGEIPSTLVYEDERVAAFADTNPQAPTHLLIVPKKHIATLNELEESEADLIGQISLVAKKLAQEAGIANSGYRLVLNCNAEGGQSVYHIHAHLLGGRTMHWPPG